MKKTSVIFLTFFLLSCSTYKSYKISDNGEISRKREKQIKYTSHYGERMVKNLTYYIPSAICLKNDTVALKTYADKIYTRHWGKREHPPQKIQRLKMISDTVGIFENTGVGLRDAYCDLTYYKTKFKIVYRKATSYF